MIADRGLVITQGPFLCRVVEAPVEVVGDVDADVLGDTDAAVAEETGDVLDA